MPIALENPILIVGCGRSGTTLLYEMLAEHPDLGWFSNHSTRLGTAKAAYLSRFPLPNRLKGKPSEGYALWDRCFRPHSPDRPLRAEDAEPEVRACVRKMVSEHLIAQSKSRFLNKNTRNSRRVPFLQAIFPDAHFVHVLRDPVATAASLINTPWWLDLPLWTEHGQTPAKLMSDGRASHLLAAELWIAEVEEVLMARKQLAPNRYMEIRYETFTNNPEAGIAELLQFLNLRPSSSIDAVSKAKRISNQNFRASERLTEEEQKAIKESVRATALVTGYAS